MHMTQFVEQPIPVHANGRIKSQRWHISECRPKQLAVFPVKAVQLLEAQQLQLMMFMLNSLLTV